jgi:hypothetical protein
MVSWPNFEFELLQFLSSSRFSEIGRNSQMRVQQVAKKLFTKLTQLVVGKIWKNHIPWSANVTLEICQNNTHNTKSINRINFLNLFSVPYQYQFRYSATGDHL